MPRCVAQKCNENGNHVFPKNEYIRSLWEKAAGIKKAKIGSRLCWKHFKKSDYLEFSITSFTPLNKAILKKDAVPSIFDLNKPFETAYVTESHAKKQPAGKKVFLTIAPVMKIGKTQLKPDVTSNNECDEQSSTVLGKPTVSTQTNVFRLLTTDQLLSDSDSVWFYTGLRNIDEYNTVLTTVLPMTNTMLHPGNETNLTSEDQFLLVLIKFRRNKADFELAKIFAITTSQVGNILVTWINFVYKLWSKMDVWPSKSLINYYMSEIIKTYQPSAKVLSTVSDSKTTLPGATPAGIISIGPGGSIVSKIYQENTKLGTVIQTSNGNSIMAECNIEELFLQKHVFINIPKLIKFLKASKQAQIQNSELEDKIERLLDIIKTYQILKSYINPLYVPLISKIFFICVILCKFIGSSCDKQIK